MSSKANLLSTTMYSSTGEDQRKGKSRRIYQRSNQKKLIFIRNHLPTIFPSTATDDTRRPCLIGARVLVNGGNFPEAQTKKGGNCCQSLRRRRRLPHFQPYRLNLLSISEAAVIFCHAVSDLTLFYCNKRASRCGWPHSSIRQQFFQL